MTRQIPWLRVFVEGGVIVGSILLAFGIQAWWDGRGERVMEAAAMESLARDFEAIQDQLSVIRLEHLSRIEAADRVLRLTGPQPNVEDPHQVVADLTLTKNLNPLSINSTTLQSLLQSSGLEVLRSDELRRALSEWTQDVEAIEESQEWAWTVVTEWESYLVERVPLRAVDPADSYAGAGPGGSAFDLDMENILRSVTVENHIHRQRQASQSILHFLDRLDRRSKQRFPPPNRVPHLWHPDS